MGGGTGATQDEALSSAMVGCRDVNLGTACDIIHVNDANIDVPCLALVKGTNPAQWAFGEGATPAGAEADALAAGGAFDGAAVIGSGCATPGAVTSTAPGTATVTSDVDIYQVPDGVGTRCPASSSTRATSTPSWSRAGTTGAIWSSPRRPAAPAGYTRTASSTSRDVADLNASDSGKQTRKKSMPPAKTMPATAVRGVEGVLKLSELLRLPRQRPVRAIDQDDVSAASRPSVSVS